jgi:hypothetical protein
MTLCRANNGKLQTSYNVAASGLLTNNGWKQWNNTWQYSIMIKYCKSMTNSVEKIMTIYVKFLSK